MVTIIFSEYMQHGVQGTDPDCRQTRSSSANSQLSKVECWSSTSLASSLSLSFFG